MDKQKIKKSFASLGKRTLLTSLSAITFVVVGGLTIWAMAAFTEPTTGPAASVQDFAQNILGANNADNGFDSSAVVGNNNGSLVERLEYVSSNTNLVARTQSECADADAVGTACGGGIKFATGLVSLAGGCNGQTDEPICSGTDALTLQWSYNTSNLSGAASITAGSANTAILAYQNGNAAATYCYDMIKNGYDDWYLPAKNELHTLYGQRTTVGGGFTGSTYWSSSEDNATSAWGQNFADGSQTNYNKSFARYVRCVRRY